MGSNRRYPSHSAELIGRRVDEVVTRPQPISLTDAELDKDHQSVTTAREPIPVRAWVRFLEGPVRAEARALAWTSRAVFVEVDVPGGGLARVWVWASAVQRKQE